MTCRLRIETDSAALRNFNDLLGGVEGIHLQPGWSVVSGEAERTTGPQTQQSVCKRQQKWEALSETIIQVPSEPSTGGAIRTKDQQGWTSDGRLTGQSALILGLGQFCWRTICGMLQAQFQLGSKGLVYLEMTCSLLRNDSIEERSNSAFLTKILAGKLPITWLQAEIWFQMA